MIVDFDLTGRVALVTGSTRGIGRALAQAMGEQGAEVVINGRGVEAVAETVADFTALGIQAHGAAFDVADTKAAKHAVRAQIAALGKIDILINNAGIIHREPVMELDDEDWQRVMDVNLTACFALARECGKSMVENKWGRIINIASVMAMVARPTISPYVSTKHGLIGLSKALAVELGPHGVTTNAINPGYIVTDINEALINDPEFNELVKNRTPVGRWGTVDELAGACVFLASNSGAYTNGTMITVDGGMTAALY
jgi:gluconate 5-dehydrogenase